MLGGKVSEKQPTDTKAPDATDALREIEAAELLFSVTFASLKDGISQREYIDLA